MCAKLLKNSGPKRILVVSLTNIGDVVLTCPVLDILRSDFPQAKIDVMIGQKAGTLFSNNPNFGLKVFDKQSSFNQKIAWFLDLHMSHYDCVVDLRRTALAFFLSPRYATPLFPGKPPLGHKKDIHLNRLRQVYDFGTLPKGKYAILTTKDDEKFFEETIAPYLQGQNFIVISPGAADSAKRWHPQGFSAVADQLSANYKIVFVGDAQDAALIEDIQGRMNTPSMTLAGKMNLRQLAYVLKKCSLAMTHDSGVMHLACYFNVPVLVLWGPTDLTKYAPWTQQSEIVRRNEKCIRCQDPKSKNTHNCMSYIQVDDVLDAVKKILIKIFTNFPSP